MNNYSHQGVFCRIRIISALILGVFVFTSGFGQELPYRNPDLTPEERAADLLSRMNLTEKIGQMNKPTGFQESDRELIRQGKISGLYITDPRKTNKLQRIAMEETRLRIPLIFSSDVVHGFATVFPIPLGEASTWNPALIRKSSEIAAKEATSHGIRWTYAPMVDVARDPRWGRIAEGGGEDPYLNAILGRAKIRGFMHKPLSDPESMLYCIKHYVGYGAAIGGRDYNTTELSERTLREIYLPPFYDGIMQDPMYGTVMGAFNDLNGIPATANEWTLTEILRDEWGFKGFVISDFDAVAQLIDHGVAKDTAEAARLAVTAGVDMDMGDAYIKTLEKLVESGELDESMIDRSVKRILRVKFALGLFDRPYTDLERTKHGLLRDEYIKVARQAARESIVLLKNEGALLPLKKNSSSIAVIGPLANSREDLLGSWSAHGDVGSVVSVLEGIKQAVPDSSVVYYSKGCTVSGTDTSGFKAARNLARNAEVAILVIGEGRDMSGEAASRTSLDLPGVQSQLVKEIHKTSAPMVEVLMNGRPLTINWSAEHVPAILETWFGGIQAGPAIADVLFGDYNPGGKLPVTFPRSVGQVPKFYNHKNTGRPPSDYKYTSKYLNTPWTPLFPFGYGLSYTSFKYSNFRIEKKQNSGESFPVIEVSVDITNTEELPGEEVVQLYIRDKVASVTRPVKELRDFRRIMLDSGQSKTVKFTLEAEDFAFYDQAMNRIVEAGDFEVMIGGNSRDVLTQPLTIENSYQLKTTD